MIDSTCHPEPREADSAGGEPLPAGAPPRQRAAARGALPLPGAKGRWRAGNLIWLIYSVFFIIEPLQQGSPRLWLLFAAVYPCFLAIYLTLIFSSSRRTRKLLLLALAILGGAYYPMNPSAGASLFIYVAAFAPFVTTSFGLAAGTIAAAALVSAAEGLLLHLSPWVWGGVSFIAASIGAGNLISALRMGATERLLHAQEQIEHLATVRRARAHRARPARCPRPYAFGRGAEIRARGQAHRHGRAARAMRDRRGGADRSQGPGRGSRSDPRLPLGWHHGGDRACPQGARCGGRQAGVPAPEPSPRARARAGALAGAARSGDQHPAARRRHELPARAHGRRPRDPPHDRGQRARRQRVQRQRCSRHARAHRGARRATADRLRARARGSPSKSPRPVAP